MNTVGIRKIVYKESFKPGIYSGTLTGFVATFMYEKEEYECHVMQSIKGVKVPCHVIITNDNEITINHCCSLRD